MAVKLQSNDIPEFSVTWVSRIERPGGKTNPEELLAAEQALKVTTMSIKVTGKVPGMQKSEFEETAKGSLKNLSCRKRDSENVKIELSANLS